MATECLLDDFLPVESVQLGRLVRDVKRPNHDFLDPLVGRPDNSQLSQGIQGYFTATRRLCKPPTLLSYLGSILSIPSQKKGDNTNVLMASRATSYDLKASGDWLKIAKTLNSTNKWLHSTRGYRQKVYLVVALRTVQNAWLVKDDTIGTAQGGRGTGIGCEVIKPNANVEASGLSLRNLELGCTLPRGTFLPGERIFAILYRIVKPAWLHEERCFSWTLGPDCLWVSCWDYTWKGPLEGDSGETGDAQLGKIMANPTTENDPLIIFDDEELIAREECIAATGEDHIAPMEPTHDEKYTTDNPPNCAKSELSCLISVEEPERLPAHLFKLETTFHEDHVIHKQGDATANNAVKWARVKVLGEGGQGIVYLETSETQPQLIAVKKIPQRHMRAHSLDIKQELHALIAVKDFFGWYEDNLQEYIYLAMEYVPHGDLGTYLKDNGSEAQIQAQSISKQLLTGIAALHKKQICHRDLKPQNILIACLSPIHVKLADFGISKCTIETDLRTETGTTNYMAPELRRLLPRQLRLRVEYTNGVDLWALGCVVYEILALENPFQDTLQETRFSGMATMKGPFPIDTYVLSEFCKGNLELPIGSLIRSKAPKSAVDFIQRVLVADPRLRMSAADGLNY